MIRVLRTIAIIDAVSVAVFAVIGWLFGMTPSQTLGATVIGSCSIALVLGWRAIVNAPPSRPRRDEWQHLGCDPVAPPLPAPLPQYRIEAPIAKEIDHVTVDFPRISSTPVRLLSAPPNHRDGRTAD